MEKMVAMWPCMINSHARGRKSSMVLIGRLSGRVIGNWVEDIGSVGGLKLGGVRGPILGGKGGVRLGGNEECLMSMMTWVRLMVVSMEWGMS